MDDKNESQLNDAKNILVKLAKNSTNPKFKKLGSSDLHRAKRLQNEFYPKRQKFKTYKKGTIIYADFGTGIGQELSFPHFAVVIEKYDNPFKSVLTVLPLTSKNKKHFLNLEEMVVDTIYSRLLNQLNRYSALDDYLRAKLENSHEDERIFQKLMMDDSFVIVEYLKTKNIHLESDSLNSDLLFEAISSIYNDVQKLKKVFNKYQHIKHNTFANPNNIATISKLRIAQPINEFDPVGTTIVNDIFLERINHSISQVLGIDNKQ